MISMDFVGPLDTTSRGNRYILNIIDHYSSHTESTATRDQSTEEVLRVLLEWISRNGAPQVLLSDRGQSFLAQVVNQLCEVFSISRRYSAAYHPQANGKVENANKTMKNVLKKIVRKSALEWDQVLPMVNMAYNSSQHRTTGFSPFYILHGFQMRLPTDLVLRNVDFGDVHAHIAKLQRDFPNVQQTVMTAARDAVQARLREPEVTYEVGDNVWTFCPGAEVSETSKLSQPWVGPVTVLEKLGDSTYRLDIPKSWHSSPIRNTECLRPYGPGDSDGNEGGRLAPAPEELATEEQPTEEAVQISEPQPALRRSKRRSHMTPGSYRMLEEGN